MRKNRPAASPAHQRKVDAHSPALVGCERASPPPAALRLVDESSLPTMAPGDILLLDDALSLRESVEPIFFAVLACPVCGTRGLITPAQYFGLVPVICGSKVCSGLFRIVDQDHLLYLPVS